MKRLTQFLGFVIISVQLYSQNGSIRGIVIDTISNPIESVTIKLSVINANDTASFIKGIVSDTNGNFTFQNVASGKYIIEVSHLNYDFNFIEIVLVKDKSKLLNPIVLKESLNQLNEIIISGKKLPIIQKTDRVIINVDQNIVSSGGTAIDILKQLSIVNITSDGTVSIKGKSDISILIDGKPSGFAALQGQRFLSQLDLNTIEKIEVITNPSVIKSGNGAGGVINIIRKKNIKSGFNGSLNAGFGSDEWYHFSPQLNYRTGDFNMFFNYSFRNRKRLNTNITFKEQQLQDGLQLIDENQHGTRNDKRNNVEFGLDYYLSKKKYVTLSANYRNREKTNLQERQTVVTQLNTSTELRVGQISEPETNEGWGATAQYKSSYDADKKLTILLDYVHSVEDEDIFREELAFSEDSNFIDGKQSFYIDTNDRYLIDIENELPISEKIKINLGAQAVYRKINQTFNVFVFNNSSNLYENFPNSNDEFNYEDFITSVYSQIETTSNKWSYEAAIRLELLNNKYNSESTNIVFKDNYFNILSSLKLTHDFTDRAHIVFSAKKGINRPSPNRLNPFPDVSNAFNVSIGNPELNPEIFYNFETGLSTKINKLSIVTGLFLTVYTDLIQQITELRDDGLTYKFPINIDDMYHYGTDFSLQTKLTEWWNQQFGGVLYNRIYKDGHFNTSEKIAYSLKSITTISISKQFEAQIFGSYNSPENSPQGEIKSIYYFDLGIEYKFSKNKARLSIVTSDIFNSLEENSILINQGLRVDNNQKINTRRVYASFRYKF